MNKFCSAGKIECAFYSGINCNVRPSDPLHIIPAYQVEFEQCPWPSRQVPVEKPELNVSILEVNGSSLIATNKWTGERWSSINGKDWEKIDPVRTDYRAGRADMKQDIVTMIKEKEIDFFEEYNNQFYNLICAIEGVK